MTILRKSRLVVPEPKAGRYAVFDWLPQGRRRCRLCGARVRKDNAWKHWETELRGEALYQWRTTFGIERYIAFLLRARRSRKNRRQAQYQHATKGEPWR